MPPLSFLPRADINPSVLYDRLRSSSSHQRSEISQILKNIDNDLEDYASEICTLGARIAFLSSHRERLQNHRLILSTLLSPVHRLSNELLIRIFIFACEYEELSEVECANECTLSVAAVCCRWRGLAISCSRLWSNISLTLPAIAISESRSENRLDLFLARSRQHLLALDIYIDSPRDVSLLEKLLKHAPRWQHLCLSIPSHEPDDFPSLYNAHLPFLETYIGDNRFFRNPFPSKLRSISTIRSLAFLMTISPPPALANKVTSLAFAPHSDSLFEPLSWFPNLVHLALQSNFDDGPPDEDSPRSVSITSLDISTEIMVSDLDGIIDLLGAAMDFLTAPKLSALVVTSVTSPKEFTKSTLPYSFSRIYTFIERSGCSLTVLKLHKLSIPDSCIVDLLRHLDSLVELSLEDPQGSGWGGQRQVEDVLDYPISKCLIESLHTHQKSSLHLSGRPIVPNLRTLVLRVYKTRFHHQSFVSTISSRWIPDKTLAAEIGVACLCSVELHLSEPVNQARYLPLAPLEKLGMRIVVKQTKQDV